MDGTPIVGAGMSALALRTEENVRAALTSQVAGNETMTGFAAQLWDGLNDALSFPIALLAAIIEQLFPGLDLTTDSMSELLASVSEVPVLGDLVEMLIGVEDGNLDDLGTWFLNMRDFFGDLNFLDPEFDAGQAVEDFVDMLLLLPGKLVDTLGLEEAIENSRQWLKDTFTGIVDATDTDLDNWLLDLVTSGSLDTALENGVDGVSQWVRDTLTGLVDATDTDLDNWVLDLGNSITGFFTKLGGGSNMVVDPTFTSTSQWRCSSNTGELSTDSAHSGTLAWKATLAGGTNVVVSLGSDSRSLAFDAPGLMWKVRPAESYVVELWVRGDTGNSGGSADVDLTALVVDSKGVHSQLSPVLATVEMSEAMHASEWTKLSATYRIPAGYDRFTVYLRVVGASAGDVLFVDDAVVREETGSQDIVTKFLNAWGGSDLETAAGAVPQAAVAGLGGIIANINSWFTTGANLVGDPTGSKASYWDGGQLDGQHAISTGFKHSGLTSLKMTALSGSAISWPVFRDGDGAGTTVPVRPGQKYEVSMWIRGHSANVSVGAEAYIQANISDSSGVESTQFHVVEDDFKPDPDNFYKYGGIVTIPAGYDRMDVRPYWSVDAITGDDMFIDDISVKDITESQNIKDKLTDTTDATDSDLDDWILSLADGSAVDAWQQWLADTLTGFVDSTPGDLDNWLLSLVTDGKVPLSSITDEEPNLVRDPTFRSVSTLNGEPGWTLDDSFVHSESGNAAKISCNGTTRELGLGTFPVVSDQPVKASIFAQWSGGVANLVGSPMVEYGSQWTLANGALIASDQSFSGSKSIKLPGGGPVSTASIDAIPVTPGVQYHVRFRARKDAAYNGSVGNSKLRWGNANSSDALIDAWSFASTDIPAPDAWYNFEAVKTVPEGVTSLNVRLSCDATAGNVWIDDVVITPTTAPVRVIAESYKNGNLVNEEVIAAAPADETCYDTLDWVELSGEIVASGADRVRILLQIDEKASYGNVWWSDVSVTKTVTATAPPTWIDGLTSTFDAIGEFIQWIGTIILEALTGLPLVGWLFDDLYESFNDLFNTSNDAFANAEDALGDAADAQDTADAAVSAAGVAQSTATGAASAASAAQGTADAALADAADAMAAAEAAASALAAKIAAGQSICTNPGFEDDGLFMGAWTRTTSHRHSGTVSVTATGSGSGQTAWLTTDATAKVSISAQADDVFYCEFFVRGDTDNVQTSGAPAGVRVFASCNDATTVGFATPTIASHEASTAINGEWSKASGYVTLPAGTVSFTPGLYLASEVVSGDTYWVDDVKVIDVTEAYNAKAVADAALAAAGVADAKAVAADGKAVVADGKAEAAQSAADEAQGAAEDINVFLFAQTTPGTSIDQDRITGLPADVARLNAMGASGSNLIADPSCEDTSLDSIRAGFAFSSGGSGAYSHDDAQYVTGTRSIKYVYGGGTSYPSLKLTTDLSSNPIPVRPGQVFYMAQRVYVDPSNTGTGNVQLFLACLDNDGGPTTYPNANLPYITATGEWVLQEAYLTVSANCFEMYPYFASVRPGNDSGDTFWFDSFQLYEVTDASKINQALFGQAGPGVELITDAVPVLPQSKVTDLTTDLPAAQSTASTALTNAATAQAEAEAKVDIDLFTASMNKGSNLVVDPQFTTTAIPRSAYGGGGAYSTDVKRGGTYSYKWTADGTTTRGMYFNIDAYGGVSLSTSGGDGVEAGDVFYHEVWIYSHASNNHSGAGSLGFVTRWVDSTGVLANAYSSHSVSIDEITPGTWTKLSYHATCPDGYNQAVVFCTSSAAVASGNIYYADTPIWREVTQGYVALSAADEAESAALAAQLDADTAQGTANTAVTNAATADAKAVTAQGVADIAKVLAKSQLSGGANLIGNPGFENAEFYHGEGVQSSEQARSGTYSRKKVQTGAYGIIRMNTDDSGYVTIPCRPSDVFYLEAWVYAPASNTGSYRTWFQFYWLDESGGQAGAGTSPVIWPDNTPDTWVKMSAVIHAPSSNVVGMDRLWLVTDVNAPAGNVYYFDDVIVQNITEAYNAQLAADAAQADADTAQGTANTAVSNAATADAKAVGAQNDADAANAALLTKLESAVFKASIQSGANLIPNPSFRDTSLNAKHLARAEYSGWSFDSSFKRSGSQSLKFVGPAGTAYPAINMTPDLADAFDKNTDEGFIPVVAGQVFYLSCWVYADPSNTGNNRVRHYIWGRGSVSQALSVASADIVGGEWVQVAGYVTIPSGRNLMVPHMASARMTDGVDDGDTFWFDDFECYEVTEAYNAAVDAATAQGTANTAVTNAATADAKAVTADGKAVAAQSAADAADAKAVEAQDTLDASAASANLVISPNFEDNWVTRFTYGSVTLAYTTAQSFQGHQSLSFTCNAANWTGVYLSPTLNVREFRVNPGDVIAAKLQIKPHGDNDMSVGYVRLYLRWMNSHDGTYTDAGNVIINNTAMASTWQPMVAKGTGPSQKDILHVFVISDPTTPVGNTYYIDAVSVQEVTEAHTAQGTANTAVSNAATAQGTANTAVTNAATADAKAVTADGKAVAAQSAAATADAKAVAARTALTAALQGGDNICSNPGFEDISQAAGFDEWSYSSEQKRNGYYSLKLTSDGTTYSVAYLVTNGSASIRVPVSSGDVFYVEYWIYGHENNNQTSYSNYGLAILVQYRSGDNTYHGSGATGAIYIDDTSLNGAWTKMSGYLTVPPNDAIEQAEFFLLGRCADIDNGDIYYFDDVVVKQVKDAVVAKTAADTAQGTANTAVTNAATADAKAVAADGKAVTAQSAADAADAKAVEAQDTIDASAASSNLVISPNFEDDWVTRFAYGSAPLAYTTAQSFQGHQCIQFTSHVANWTGLYLSPTLNARRFTVNPGDVMAAKLQVKPHGSNNMSVGYVRVWMRWYNSHDGTYTDNYSGTHTINNTAMLSSWQQLSITGTCPSQKDLLDVFVLSDPTTPVGNIYYVDAVSVQEVTEASNAQSTADDAVSDAATAQGTANTANTNAGIADGKAEDAQATADAAFPHDSFDAYLAGANNLVVNPTFEDTSFYVGPASYSTAYKHWGTRSLKMTGTGADQYARLVSNKTSTLRIQAHPGQYFYIEYWVYAPTSNVGSGYGRACSVGLWCYDSSNVYQQAFIVDGAVGDIGEGSWVKRSGTVGPITDPDVTNAVIYLYLDQDVPSGDDFYFDDIIVKEVTEAVEAQDAADTADSKAEDAQDAADTADGKAEDAQDAADTADSKAENAQDDVDSVIDNVANSFLGGDELSGASVSDARDAMDKVYSDLSKNTRAIQDLQAKQAGAKAKGTVVSIDFSDYADGNLPSIFDVSYTGAGTSTLGVVNGVAQWRNTNNADRRGKVVYNGDGTATDFQIIRGTMAMAPQEAIGGGKPYFYAIGRVSDDGDDYVWARAYCNGWFIYKCDIGYAVNNVETTWSSNNNLTWSLDMSFVLGVGSDPRTYQVWSGNTMVKEYTESGTASKLGAGYRQWGCIAEIKSGSGGPRISGKISGSSVADNAPPDVNGSTARMYRVGTGTVSFPSGGPTAIPNSFFSHIGHESPDVDANTTYGTFTVAESKPYIINARIRRTASMFSIGTLVLQVKPSGGSWGNSQYGPDHYMGHGSSAISGSWIQYLNEGDQVRLATYNTGGALTCLSGESDGEETYFAIAGAG